MFKRIAYKLGSNTGFDNGAGLPTVMPIHLYGLQLMMICNGDSL